MQERHLEPETAKTRTEEKKLAELGDGEPSPPPQELSFDQHADLLYSRNKWHMLCNGLSLNPAKSAVADVLKAVGGAAQEVSPPKDYYCVHCKTEKPEGVAAPLEPSRLTADQFYCQKLPKDGPINEFMSYVIDSDETRDKIFEFAEAYAAAVSKNLQVAEEDLCPSCSNGISRCDCKPPVDYKTKSDHLWRRHVRSGKKLQHKSIALHKAESRILELEKEITALRESK